MTILALAAISLAVVFVSDVQGPWRAWLDCPGGELPFGIELERDGDELRGVLLNGSERIEIPRTSFVNDTLLIDMPHYDSQITATLTGDSLTGTWRKRRGLEEWTEMGFHARRGDLPRFHEIDARSTDELNGRWSVKFDSSDALAVAEFSTDERLRSEGTFLTTTGDYRYLAGDFAGGELRLSCFDGAHAFLFTARLSEDGTLTGDFWSRDTWHETWTASRNENATLPDAFKQTVWKEGWSLGDVIFPDLDGNPRSLADPAFAGKARILQVFGSWCPNCNDEGRYLAELEERYGDRGLSILGLAFELTGDHERDAHQVRRYQERNGVSYPVLIAGTADKQGATRAFPALDFVRSYPTTIFLHQDGRVRAVHSGFTGPATGAAYDKLRDEFEGLIEELLAEPEQDLTNATEFLIKNIFIEQRIRERSGRISYLPNDFMNLTFERKRNQLVVRVPTYGNVEELFVKSVHISGSNVLFADEVLRIDYESGVLLDARRFGRRFIPILSDRVAPPRLTEAQLLDLAASPSDSARSEAILSLTKLKLHSDSKAQLDIANWLEDDSLHVELAAIWSAGVLRNSSVRDQLVKRLVDPNAAVRRESVIALDRIGLDDNIRQRLNDLKKDSDPFVREVVRDALGE